MVEKSAAVYKCRSGKLLVAAHFSLILDYMKSMVFMFALLMALPALATEVYHWVDENGVSHFTQNAPAGDVSGVEKMIIEDTTPPDYDPDEDRYDVQAQAERMAALREEMKEKREEDLKRQRNAAAQQPAVQYRDPYQYGYPGFWNRPVYPKPPPRPERPIEIPYKTDTLAPPGSRG